MSALLVLANAPPSRLHGAPALIASLLQRIDIFHVPIIGEEKHLIGLRKPPHLVKGTRGLPHLITWPIMRPIELTCPASFPEMPRG